MAPELTNLLPDARIRSLRQLYFLRLAVVGVLLLAAVTVVHAVLLLPSYLYLAGEVSEREASLASITARLEGSEEKEVGARVASLAEDSAYLARLATVPKVSAAVSAIIALPRPGIAIQGFSFSPVLEGGAVMTLSGTAMTREALRAYEQSLASQSYIASADLPISAYAQESDIDFTITLTGPFLP